MAKTTTLSETFKIDEYPDGAVTFTVYNEDGEVWESYTLLGAEVRLLRAHWGACAPPSAPPAPAKKANKKPPATIPMF